jgi:hypothetical protein
MSENIKNKFCNRFWYGFEDSIGVKLRYRLWDRIGGRLWDNLGNRKDIINNNLELV